LWPNFTPQPADKDPDNLFQSGRRESLFPPTTSMAQISFSLRQCVQSFKLLNQILEESNYDADFVGRLRGAAGRFRIWAENAGAHRIGKVSLDHRLREASKVKQMVIDLLDALNDDLQQGNYLKYLTI
jgi:DNA-binding phage protein